MISDGFRCFPMFSTVSRCFRLFSDNVFRLLKFSSSWTKLSMMGPQLFSGWYQMILDVCQCSQLFFDVFSWVVTFMDNHPLCGHFFSGCLHWSQIFYKDSQMCSRCTQMFSYVHRCFRMITDVSEKLLQKIVLSGNYQLKLKKGMSQGAI